jgi:hypothetical protein
MDVLAFILGLSVGAAFLAPALRRARAPRGRGGSPGPRALERNGTMERLVTQVAATVERVERELRRIDRRPRAKRR